MTTTTKTIREIQYLGPDGQPLDYVPNAANAPGNGGPPQVHPRLHGNQKYVHNSLDCIKTVSE